MPTNVFRLASSVPPVSTRIRCSIWKNAFTPLPSGSSPRNPILEFDESILTMFENDSPVGGCASVLNGVPGAVAPVIRVKTTSGYRRP